MDLGGVRYNTIHTNDDSFHEELDAVVQYGPADAFNPELVGLWASIGIKKGRPFAPDECMKRILVEAAAVGNATARALSYCPRSREPHFYEDRQWNTAFVGGRHEFMTDGSSTVWFAPTAPAGKEGNWCRPCPARAGRPCCASTGRSSRGSKRRGSPVTSSWCSSPARWPLREWFDSCREHSVQNDTTQAQPLPMTGTIDSRIRSLRFEAVYPAEERLVELHDEFDFRRAVQIGCLGVVLALPVTAIQATESPDRFSLEVEAAAGWQARNDVQIPNNASGTRFSIADTVGSGPVPAVRVDFTWALNDRQELRFLVAPFGYEESGTLPGPVNFNGANFDAASPTEIRYRFNSYRATWRYRVFQDEDWTVKLGLTGNIRQAEIALTQGGISSSRTDVGFVPLLNVWAERRFAGRWRLVLDLDGLAAPQGRAFDISAKVGYDLASNLTLTAGLRMLDGGGDNDEVYNFARFYYGIASVVYRF